MPRITPKEKIGLGASSAGTLGQTYSNPDTSLRDVPLSFWLGPKKLGAFNLRVQNEARPVDPFEYHLFDPPDLSDLP